MDVKRIALTAWEWRDGNQGWGVRAFPNTRKLIYSSWTESAEGPHFNDGVAQTFDQFLAGDAPPFDVPQEVRNHLTTLIAE